jgi:hypothetical protein
MVDLEPSDSSSDSDDGVPKIVEVFSDSDIEALVEFEPMIEGESLMDIIGPWKVEFEDFEADKPRRK